MNRWLVPAIIATAVAFLVSVGVLLALRPLARPATPIILADEGYDGLAVPEFTLTTQAGEPATEELLEGHITIVDFIFTHCPLACPGMTGAMADLSQRLKNSGVRFASFSVDPEHDTPERLREYAALYEADLSRWTFLTGDAATTERILEDGLKFAIRDDEAIDIPLPDGSSMANILHPTKLVLIGPDRRVLGMYDYTDPKAMDTLAAKAKAAASLLD